MEHSLGGAKTLKDSIGVYRSLCWKAITEERSRIVSIASVSDLPCLMKVIGKLSYPLHMIYLNQ